MQEASINRIVVELTKREHEAFTKAIALRGAKKQFEETYEVGKTAIDNIRLKGRGEQHNILKVRQYLSSLRKGRGTHKENKAA